MAQVDQAFAARDMIRDAYFKATAVATNLRFANRAKPGNFALMSANDDVRTTADTLHAAFLAVDNDDLSDDDLVRTVRHALGQAKVMLAGLIANPAFAPHLDDLSHARALVIDALGPLK